MVKRIDRGDEDWRRASIGDASRSKDPDYLPQLLARLNAETPSNRRQIIRALGNIGGEQAEDKLLELLGTEAGLTLGDVIQALGRLKSRRAVLQLLKLTDHSEEWVRQNVKFALRATRGR